MARQFGSTWWGKAWVRAIESGITADTGRLSRGRTYARQGRVGIPEIIPGLVRAEVTGSEEYVADLSVRPLGNEAWTRLIELIASRSANAAALLSGELPVQLLDEATEHGVHLLPGPGEVTPDCSCPDWGEPCKHAAALAYLVADAVDQDPFVLLLLRGRGRSELMDAIRTLRAERSSGSGAESDRMRGAERPDGGSSTPIAESPDHAGVDAVEAFARTLAPLPPPIDAPAHAGSPVALGAPPPIDSGLRLSELEALAADAAIRATDLLHQIGTSGLELTSEADLARRAAEAFNRPTTLLGLSQSSGRELAELTRMALAWHNGGVEGLWIMNNQWEPSLSTFETARMLISPRARVSANTVTGNGIQLRVDRSGRWWRFRADEDLGWVLASQGFVDPAELF